MSHKQKALFVVTAVLLICAFALLPGGCGGKEEPNTGSGDGARETITGTLHSFKLLHDSMERSYLVYVPGFCEAGAPLPVVVTLHGAGGTAAGMVRTSGWDAAAEREGFIAVFPNAVPYDPEEPPRFYRNPQVWNDGSGRSRQEEAGIDDTGFIGAMLDDLISRYSIDLQRVYVNGISNGASMAFRLGIELSHRFSAVAAVAGHCWFRDAVPERPLSLLYIIGGADPLAPPAGGTVRLPWGTSICAPPPRESVMTWARMVECPLKPRFEEQRDGMTVQVYEPGLGGARVVFYEVHQMGHVWPGGVNTLPKRLVGTDPGLINATALIWDFFQSTADK